MPGIWLPTALLLLGHNPETSYAEIKIAADKVQMRLTYDVVTLSKIVPLDDNRDGKLARSELTGHLPQIDRFLRDHIEFKIDDDQTGDLGVSGGFVWPPGIGDEIPESEYHALTGLIIFEFSRPVKEMPQQVFVKFKFFRELGDRHTVLGNFRMKGDDYEVTFDNYQPDFTYFTGVQPKTTSSAESPPPTPTAATPLSHRLWRFFKLGVEHIFLGYDHICFLIALIVVSKFREIVKIVTSFTIAHSITLILATLDVVRLPTRLVETCIAATIVYVAVENLWVKDTRHRWWLTFFFGLVHGFGFANVLREMGLPKIGLVRCLLSFNIGVEVGQLAIALALLPLALLLARWKYGRWATIGISILLALFGLAWFVERAFDLKFMPI